MVFYWKLLSRWIQLGKFIMKLENYIHNLENINPSQQKSESRSALLCPWISLDKNVGGGSHSSLQGIFQTQESNLGLLHCRQNLKHLNHQQKPALKAPRSYSTARKDSTKKGNQTSCWWTAGGRAVLQLQWPLVSSCSEESTARWVCLVYKW